MADNPRFSTVPAPALTPFWRRLPGFFLFPVQGGSLLRIVGYAVMGTIAMLIPPLLGALLRVILWIVFLRYAFLVMERSANGRFDALSDIDAQEEGETAQVVRQYALFIVMGLVIGVFAGLFGRSGYSAGFWITSALMPASVMIIAVTHSIGQALNPRQIGFYIKTIGAPYFALCFFLLSFSVSSKWLRGFLYGHMQSWLALPLLSFIEFYFVLIVYHMMGYVIYQYHDKLGLAADVSFEEAEARLSPGKGTDPLLARLNALTVDGQNEEALALLRDSLRQRWDENDLHERYQKLLVLTGHQAEALRHAREFIAKLAGEKRMFQALDLCEQAFESDPGFQLQDASQIRELAAAAHLARRHRLALDLMRRFDKRYPGHSDIPAIYLLSAQVLGDHYKRHREALQILRAIQAKFPDHALAGEARRYAEVLEKISALASAPRPQAG